MRKSTFIATAVCSLTMLLSINANAQKFPDLDKSPLDAAWYPNDYKETNKVARIIYGLLNLKDVASVNLHQMIKFGELELMKLLKSPFTPIWF